MSRRELKALLDSQESLPTTTTTRRRPLRRGTMADTEEQSEPSAEVTREMQELRGGPTSTAPSRPVMNNLLG